MKKQYLFTDEGIKLFFNLKKRGIQENEAREIVMGIDNKLGVAREINRQYRMCYGDSHNFTNSFSEKLRIAKEFLTIAEENYNLLTNINDEK